MRRYEVPRLAFINKLDRMGADPWKVLNQARSKLRHHAAAVQVPIGLEDDFKGLIDLVHMKAYHFHGSMIGHPVENIRVVLTDGASHAVDSSELAFKLAAIYAFRQCYTAARPIILEPVMLVEIKVPTEFQGTVTGDINKRKGVIVGNDQEGDDSVITAHVPLNNMFGYSTSLRSMTQGKGEFTMEYKEHSSVSHDVQTQLVNAYKATKGTE
nr:elongation factor G-1, mitochondrial-like [Ipomoea batatas]